MHRSGRSARFCKFARLARLRNDGNAVLISRVVNNAKPIGPKRPADTPPIAVPTIRVMIFPKVFVSPGRVTAATVTTDQNP